MGSISTESHPDGRLRPYRPSTDLATTALRPEAQIDTGPRPACHDEIIAGRVYSVLLVSLLPLLVLRFLWRGLVRDRAYRERLPERLGWTRAPGSAPCIWVHAVSVGEVRVAGPLVRELEAAHPGHQVVFSTTTPGGAQEVERLFAGRVAHVWLPVDTPGATRRFLRRLAPDLGVLVETEIWPNLCRGCRDAGIPLVLVNGRLSADSARRYTRIGALIRRALKDLPLVCTRDTATARRLRALCPAVRLAVTGDMRFDVGPEPPARDAGHALREELGRFRPVWIAGSTHPGEERQILAAHARLCSMRPGALLVLVPRHPRRSNRVARLCQREGFRIARRSSGDPLDESVAVLLGDCLGELPALYAVADVSFVGGSLVVGGGHNPVEPAALGLPILVGPQRTHFDQAYRVLLEAGGAVEVREEGELAETLHALLADAGRARRCGKAARAASRQLAGAAARNHALLAAYLDEADQPRSGP